MYKFPTGYMGWWAFGLEGFFFFYVEGKDGSHLFIEELESLVVL